jgi:hypothetical protein
MCVCVCVCVCVRARGGGVVRVCAVARAPQRALPVTRARTCTRHRDHDLEGMSDGFNAETAYGAIEGYEDASMGWSRCVRRRGTRRRAPLCAVARPRAPHRVRAAWRGGGQPAAQPCACLLAY